MIIHQQNVHGHFIAWKGQVSGLPWALEKSQALLSESHSVLGHEAMTHALKVVVFQVEVELLGGR